MSDMSLADGPLTGLRVIELGRYIQGPVAALILASLGAEVIKIESVGQQDPIRQFTTFYGSTLDERGREWMSSAVNRGKRAIALDIASDMGRQVFHRLIQEADVFVTNLRDSALCRLGADFASLHALNDRLVYGRGGGFGFRGPLAAEPCQDTAGMAYGGLMDTFATGEEPNYPPGALSDVLTGTNLAAAILAGLVTRSLRGRGGLVGTSQLQSILWLQLMPVGLIASLGQRVARYAPEESSPLLRPYPTADGWIVVAVINDDQWPILARTLGLEALLDDPRFRTFEAIVGNGEELAAILEPKLRERPTKEWWHLLRQANLWAAPVNRIGDLATDEQVLANEFLVTFPDGFVGPTSPFEVGEWRGSRSAAPSYGEDTDAVLAQLGYGEDEIVELRLAGTIW